MKKFLIQSILLIALIAGAFIFLNPTSPQQTPSLPFLPQPEKQVEVSINEAKIKVEVADTQSKRSQGLGGRESLASDSGMLFIFEREEKYAFWMKGLSFALDFIWINGDKVVDILQNVPPASPGQKDEDLPIYTPAVPVDKVLEVNAGTVARYNIKVGDTIIISKQ